METDAVRLHGAALRAARNGWHVFPLWPGGKQPAMHGRQSCPGTGDCAAGHQGWEERATRDEDRIAAWWGRSGQALNVGIACGPSNLVVLDLDTPGGDHTHDAGVAHGADTLAKLAREAHGKNYQLPDDTFAVATPSSGLHLYYRAPAAVVLRNTSGAAGELLDSRANGGYVVAAGSSRPEGRYTIINDAPVAELPAWLIEPLSPPLHETPTPQRDAGPGSDRRVTAYLAKVAAKVIDAPQGSRHDVLLRAAVSLGRLVGGGDLTEQVARDSLLQAAASLSEFPDREARRCVEDGMRFGQQHARRLAR